MRAFLSVATLIVAASLSFGQATAASTDPLCGPKEPKAFALWKLLANADVFSRLSPRAEVFKFRRAEGVTLDGFKIPYSKAAAPLGALLVIQGNGTPTRQIDSGTALFADGGYDVYAVDFRGFGKSKGQASSRNVLSDYQALLEHLATRYDRVDVYGFSFGGVVAANLTPPSQTRYVVVDTAPSQLSELGFACPKSFDPVEQLKDHPSKFIFVFGGKDPMVRRDYTKALETEARALGRPVIFGEKWSHPTQVGEQLHRERNTAILAALK